MAETNTDAPKNPLREIVQPFIDLVRAPRALWGVNLAYFIEGMVYFGMLGYLAMYFSDEVFKGVEHADDLSHKMVMVLTAGITIAMLFFGFVPDKWGVRPALILSFILLLVGRVVISAAPVVSHEPGLWSTWHLLIMLGIVIVVVGYGMYQPAAYAAVRQFTTPKTAGMAFAMLYALMNFGGWLPSYAFLLRDKEYLGIGISGTFWVYTGFTLLALFFTVVLLSRRTVADAVLEARQGREVIQQQAEGTSTPTSVGDAAQQISGRTSFIPVHMWGVFIALLAAVYFIPDYRGIPWRFLIGGPMLLGALALIVLPEEWMRPIRKWISGHPLSDGKFFFFIFCLIPVQTLFTYNWFILPQYVSRTYTDSWIGKYFEIASNANPILIFIFVPLIAAITQKRKVYNMMISGTLVMAAPAFLLAIEPSWMTLFGYILIMTVGEAMWQPRFLQYAAEIAPEGRTGQYMGVAQLPWFLTKVLVPMIYSGKLLEKYCPKEGLKDTETMWLIFGCIAIISPILLFLAKPWAGKDFKTKAA